MDQVFGIGRYKNKLNLTKIKDSKMEGFFQKGPSKIQTF